MTDPTPTPTPTPTARVARIALAGAALLFAFFLGAVCFGGIGSEGPATTEVAAEAPEEVWTCAMHPQIRQAEPGQCPICGMDLIPATTGSSGAAEAGQVVLSDRARILAQIRTTPARRQADTGTELRLLGRIEPAESNRKNVTTWIGGRIDRLHVAVTGEQIRRGQTVATLYSPEIYTAHQDLITARQQVERLADSPEAARNAAEAALNAARQRLRLLGTPDDELAALEASDTPSKSVPVRSPFRGTVIERAATEGAYVQTGAVLYRVADLGTLWVQLDAYEGDLARIAENQAVRLEVQGMPGELFEGRVDFVEPTVDPQRRTARVRVEVANADGRLRPGMFAEATLAAMEAIEGAESPLVIPASAPLFTGKRSVVYVEIRTDDRATAYEPRTVRLGPRLGDVYPVVAGLRDGERVVTRGAFALDADLQIRGGPSMMTAPGDAARNPNDEPVPLTAEQRASLAPILLAYLEVQRALADDDRATAADAASRLEQAVTSTSLGGRASTPWAEVADTLRSHSRHVAMAHELETARQGFEPLSHGIEMMLRRFGNPLDEPVQVAFCPMAMGSEGARWVQQGDTIDNAYFGASMLRCGEIRSEIAPGSFLDTPAAEVARPAAGHEGHVH